MQSCSWRRATLPSVQRGAIGWRRTLCKGSLASKDDDWLEDSCMSTAEGTRGNTAQEKAWERGSRWPRIFQDTVKHLVRHTGATEDTGRLCSSVTRLDMSFRKATLSTVWGMNQRAPVDVDKEDRRLLQWSRSKTTVAQNWVGGVGKKGNKQTRGYLGIKIDRIQWWARYRHRGVRRLAPGDWPAVSAWVLSCSYRLRTLEKH